MRMSPTCRADLLLPTFSDWPRESSLGHLTCCCYSGFSNFESFSSKFLHLFICNLYSSFVVDMRVFVRGALQGIERPWQLPVANSQLSLILQLFAFSNFQIFDTCIIFNFHIFRFFCNLLLLELSNSQLSLILQIAHFRVLKFFILFHVPFLELSYFQIFLPLAHFLIFRFLPLFTIFLFGDFSAICIFRIFWFFFSDCSLSYIILECIWIIFSRIRFGWNHVDNFRTNWVSQRSRLWIFQQYSVPRGAAQSHKYLLEREEEEVMP